MVNIVFECPLVDNLCIKQNFFSFPYSYVGKSSIIKRFLHGTFDINYVATVEDLFSQDFEVGGTCLKVDILDTAGDAQFPAMRR